MQVLTISAFLYHYQSLLDPSVQAEMPNLLYNITQFVSTTKLATICNAIHRMLT